MKSPAFLKFLHDLRKDVYQRFIGTLLTFDPGETTGYCFFKVDGDSVDMVEHGQLPTNPVEKGAELIIQLIERLQPTIVVYEEYKVYDWKSASHSWSNLHTPQLIGCIKFMCSQKKIPIFHHMAQQAKIFCTDEKLVSWGFYIKGQKHARDSIRHALLYLLFTHK